MKYPLVELCILLYNLKIDNYALWRPTGQSGYDKWR